jgi:AcrR family transcriptional regulator
MLSKSEKVDPRIVRTRKLLLDAFMSLMGEKGFDDVTIQDIAERATVNRATFYAHFSDKYALLEAMLRQGFGATLQRRLQMPGRTPHEHLRRLFLAMTDHLEAMDAEHCKDSYQRFEALAEAEIKRQLRDAVQSWLDGQPRVRTVPRLRLELAATTLSWSIYGAALEWRKRAAKLSPDAFADEIVPLLVATIDAVRA